MTVQEPTEAVIDQEIEVAALEERKEVDNTDFVDSLSDEESLSQRSSRQNLDVMENEQDDFGYGDPAVIEQPRQSASSSSSLLNKQTNIFNKKRDSEPALADRPVVKPRPS